ncbi:amino acid permease [Saxibacter everestensis]|uniref:Amino acid permease n=1 Tax=Saxibacter everestensis TaxID=2909229 RepID=A0ABY8QW25_9MICO|nr:amino acid permease [Brevibacteriaceae bacterium ZFBP1038]
MTTVTKTDRPGTHPLLRRKPIAQISEEAGGGSDGGKLVRSLGLWHLTMISVGATLGTGIFVILGTAIPDAGPAVWISFIIAGIAALLSAVSYAELASLVPVSGSSYSYTYATLGEGMAWVCGWCLVLEYGVSVAAVSSGAGEYINEAISTFGLELPHAITAAPGADGGIVDLPAMLLVVLAMLLLVRGVKESALVNTVMVVIKIVILIFFCVVAFSAFSAGNFQPLFPMGAAGMSAAASRVFFSYIGFDAASTAGEEAKNPQRDLPRAILLSMVIVTSLYVLVAIAAVGAREWTWFQGSEAALVEIVRESIQQPWVAVVFSIGAIIAIASVVLTVLYGQTRILLTMSRDGLVPKVFGKLSAKTGAPVQGTLILGIAIAVTAAVIPLGELADATSIGTLFAFALVNIAVIYLRRKQPEIKRQYRVPFFPVTPLLGAAMCVYLMLNLGASTWIVFGLWMLVGVGLYYAYGRRHSRVAALSDEEYRALTAVPLQTPARSTADQRL